MEIWKVTQFFDDYMNDRPFMVLRSHLKDKYQDKLQITGNVVEPKGYFPLGRNIRAVCFARSSGMRIIDVAMNSAEILSMRKSRINIYFLGGPNGNVDKNGLSLEFAVGNHNVNSPKISRITPTFNI